VKTQLQAKLPEVQQRAGKTFDLIAAALKQGKAKRK